MSGTVVDRLRVDPDHECRDVAHRIVGKLRIGDVALRTGDDQRPVLRAAAPDLHHLAELLRIGRLAEDSMVEFFAALRRPFQKLYGAVDGDPFFVAGDEEGERAPWPPAMAAEIIQHCRELARDRAL